MTNYEICELSIRLTAWIDNLVIRHGVVEVRQSAVYAQYRHAQSDLRRAMDRKGNKSRSRNVEWARVSFRKAVALCAEYGFRA